MITVASTVVAAEASINYYNFYPAIQQIQVNLTSFQVANVTNKDSTPVLELKNMVLTIHNPTDYRGLALSGLVPTLYILSTTTNQTSSQGRLVYTPGTGPLGPGDLITTRSPDLNATSDASMLAATGNTMKYLFDIQLNIASFLDKIGSISINYVCDSPGTAVSCIEISVAISGAPGGVGGGGGGGG